MANIGQGRVFTIAWFTRSATKTRFSLGERGVRETYDIVCARGLSRVRADLRRASRVLSTPDFSRVARKSRWLPIVQSVNRSNGLSRQAQIVLLEGTLRGAGLLARVHRHMRRAAGLSAASVITPSLDGSPAQRLGRAAKKATVRSLSTSPQLG